MPLAKRSIPLQGIAGQSVHRVSTGVSTRVSTGASFARLTASQIDALPPTGNKRDIGDPAVPGLVLRVGPSGSKYWLFRYKWNATTVRLSLGPYPAVSIAEARRHAFKHREEISKGIDPRHTARPNQNSRAALPASKPGPKQSAPVRSRQATVESSIDAGIDATVSMAKSIQPPADDDAHSVQRLAFEFVEHYILPRRERPEEVIRILNKDVLSTWSKRDARTISHREIVKLLDGIVARSAPVAANRTAAIIKLMFRYGIHRGIVDQSPVQLLYAPGGKEHSRTRVLSESELAAFVQNIRQVCKGSSRSHVHMLLLLTLQRRSTLALAEWSEIDFENREWNIPSEHDKMRRGHRIPLTDWTIREFNALKALSKGSRFVLPKRNGLEPANPQLISRSIQRLENRFAAVGISDFTTHDLRRTGRTFLARLGVRPEVAESLLNHAKEQIEGTYNLYDYFAEKNCALKTWEEYLSALERGESQHPKNTQKRRAAQLHSNTNDATTEQQ